MPCFPKNVQNVSKMFFFFLENTYPLDASNCFNTEKKEKQSSSYTLCILVSFKAISVMDSKTYSPHSVDSPTRDFTRARTVTL